MNIIKAHNLTCPIDGKKLVQRNQQLVCDTGHTYDIARLGYVNLLPVQLKRSKQPGDSKAMVLARRQFLDSGIYQAVADKLSEIVTVQLSSKSESCLLDAGCGEGYYFDLMFNSLKNKQGSNNFSFIGLDISKDAIILATKRNKQISWVVGTNRQPPVEDNSVDIILCLFGFISFSAFRKVLKPDGKIIIVDPGPDHLKQLREIVYPRIKEPKPENSIAAEHSGFTLVDKKSLQFKGKITNKKQVNNLLLMTPHFYRASKEGREAACNLDELEITVDVVFRVLQKV